MKGVVLAVGALLTLCYLALPTAPPAAELHEADERAKLLDYVIGVLVLENDAAQAACQRLRGFYQAPGGELRFIVAEFYARRYPDQTDLFVVPSTLPSSKNVTIGVKSLYFWANVALQVKARYYIKTDPDAVVNLPLLKRITSVMDARSTGPPLLYAGDINWNKFDTSRMRGYCWAMQPLRSLHIKGCQKAPGDFAPFATGSLVVLSAALAQRASTTIASLDWLQKRPWSLSSYWEDRLLGRVVAHDERPVNVLYLNTHDHFDIPSGMPFVRAPSGQSALLYEHEGPGGMLVSHHVRGKDAWSLAILAQHSSMQDASNVSLDCVPFNSSSRSMPAAVGSEAASFPRELSAWQMCSLKFDYRIASQSMGHCGPTSPVDVSKCETGKQGSLNSTALGIKRAEQCASFCKGCKRCNYWSFSAYHEDCSWYSQCNLSRLSLRWAGFSYESGVKPVPKPPRKRPRPLRKRRVPVRRQQLRPVNS